MTEQDKWILDVATVKEYWAKSLEEMDKKNAQDLTIPALNALKQLVHVKLVELNKGINLCTALGLPTDVITETAYEQIKGLFQVVFYAGYLLGKTDMELEEVKIEKAL